MTRDRFEALAQAYGGDVSRWPSGEREAAAVWMAAFPDEAQAMLAGAGDLDALLHAWTPAPVPHALREQVIAAAPAPRRPSLWAWARRVSLSAGLAAACASGLIVGAAAAGGEALAPAGVDAVSAALTDYGDVLAAAEEDA